MKVFVGLSGGVDSAVSAALLKEAGHDVTGVFIKIWRPEFLECTWREDRLDAMRVAAHLSLPFREIDLSEAYERAVVREMIRTYQAGMTPNPDVSCNQYIKFGAFAEWAFGEGAERIATGHYVRTAVQGGRTQLLRGIDHDKDQSYFLHRMSYATLEKTLFPIGEHKKNTVRSLARSFDLPVAGRPDSQGLCFVGDISMPEFLRRFIVVSPGPVVDTEGAAIGEHEGAALYTIGQRHGFTIHGAQAGEPRYVVDVLVDTNTIVVSTDRAEGRKDGATLMDLHWLGSPPAPDRTYIAQARYRETPFAVRVRIEGENARIECVAPQQMSPGQSLVLYDGESVVGGGTITR